jgi:nucleolar protein 58
MLVLFETPAGHALFKVLDKGKLKNVDNIYKEFETPDVATKMVKLKAFQKFEDTTTALSAATSLCDGKLDKSLRKFLAKECTGDKVKLAVGDVKLGSLIKEKLGLKCVADSSVAELTRGIRQQLSALLTGLPEKDLNAMKLGLSHSLCRYKLKFSPDKVDTMIIQAISLLDELDKELNTYAMRVREWYGWHFPEMGKIISDNLLFAKVVKKMGFRTNCAKTDLSDILPEDIEEGVKEAAEVSMGTEISDADIENIQELCDQVTNIATYRAQLYEYLHNRMNAIAPNLTWRVCELVGARLIAHAGSLLSLAKHPASTVQILGAEKALFRALKTKHDTPKYGLIYHASLVGQATPKFKGKISRVLAAKASLSVRQDALGDGDGVTIALEHKAKVEAKLRVLEGGSARAISGTAKTQKQEAKHVPTAAVTYNESADVLMDTKEKKKKKKKEKEAAVPAVEDTPDKKKKKKDKKRKMEEVAETDSTAVKSEKKKKKKKEEAATPVATEVVKSEKKKKKKKQKVEA